MTTTTVTTITAPAVDETPGIPSDDLLERLQRLDSDHDDAGTYVGDAVDLLRASGWLALPVPVELGGAGVPIRGVVAAQRRLARSAPNAALVTAMHHHSVLAAAWRWRHGAAPAEAMLRKVAETGLFVASTGGNDFLAPSGRAVPVDGGYLVSGRKAFVSGVLSAGVINTWAIDGGGDGAEAMAMAIPTTADGVQVDECWDAVGMRGTGSHDVVLSDVFVPDAAIAARRPIGVVHPSIQAVAAHAFPVILAVYLGMADAARSATVGMLLDRAEPTAATMRTMGEVDHHLAVADRVLRSLVDDLGDDVTPSEEQFVDVMLAKHATTVAVRAAVDLMMDVVGGASYSRRLPLERAWRNVRAMSFHPLSSARTLQMAGARALDAGLL
jgi:alkylation response protein AidB-like acyl-CoA dehydrogenase